MKKVLLLPLLLFVQYGFSQADSIAQKITFAKDNYSVQYPANWRIDSSGTMGTLFFLFAPLENDTDQFTENVNFIIQDLAGQNIGIEQYKQITEAQLSQMMTDSHLFESTISKIGDKTYFKAVFAVTQGKFRLKITSWCFIQNEKAYLGTFTTEIDQYDAYKQAGEAILNSFMLLK